jgi:hypothetical protein
MNKATDALEIQRPISGPQTLRRNILLSGAAIGAAAVVQSAAAQSEPTRVLDRYGPGAIPASAEK